jgi:hypothetical protein
MNVQFYELAIRAVFEFRGCQYQKAAMSMAEILAEGPKRGWGSVFIGETRVVSDGPLLPPEVAARWKPERGHWAAVIDEMISGLPSNEGGALGGLDKRCLLLSLSHFAFHHR